MRNNTFGFLSDFLFTNIIQLSKSQICKHLLFTLHLAPWIPLIVPAGNIENVITNCISLVIYCIQVIMNSHKFRIA